MKRNEKNKSKRGKHESPALKSNWSNMNYLSLFSLKMVDNINSAVYLNGEISLKKYYKLVSSP